MRICRGFTLIELMIVVVVIALLAAVGYPSFRDHIARGQRSQGQQYLADLAQMQERILLDRRTYDTALNPPKPDGFKYGDPAITTSSPPLVFTACISPVSGSYLNSKGDGNLCLNSLGQRWREKDGDRAYTSNDTNNCAWEFRSCSF